MSLKTGTMATPMDLNRLVERYGRKLRRYARAVRELPGPVQVITLAFWTTGTG